ncbi:hypothetical protein CVT24_006077 [Panaeolus cyanescens]|uniref:Uncharacterized protein n=1 Tax=Panaeolus cyanescens TaxID=181874 RepID=A0A409V8Q9_9AGAR|nr:hypothetical protein CVT24_006077 [Panaeolus cyanescens]
MLRSLQDAHDDHLRQLLDQRSARTDVTQGRLSTLSEYSDTPSVYSRPYFSPKSYDKSDSYPYHSDYGFNSPIPHSDNRRGPIHNVSSSMLNLDDDPRSSFAPSESYDDEQSTLEDGEEQEPIARMSYLGPKMRFHSRAPWELEGDALDEEDEPEDISKPFGSGFPFSRSNGSKAINSTSSSPRPSYASRPSGESAHSTLPPKRSFETINSQISYSRGALYALAQESMSSNSLARPSQPAKETLRNKFSLGRIRSDTPTSPVPPSPSTRTFSNIKGSSSPRGYESTSEKTYSYVSTDTRAGDSVHPYANPDLVETYTDESSQGSPPSYLPPRNDSSVTVTQFSPPSGARALHPDSSTHPINPRHRPSAFQARDISSPVPVITPSQHLDGAPHEMPPSINHLPGWTERNVTPGFSLISLEEARAQRMRAATSNVDSRISTISGSSNTSAPFPSADSEASNLTQASDSSAFSVLSSRNRGRSISAGAAKAKNALQTFVGQPKPERRDSEPAVPPLPQGVTSQGKTLKHKKSGFMRLFNGNKTSERDEAAEVPPVPNLPESANISPSQTPLRPKVTIPRIPVPSISQSMLDPSNPSEDRGQDLHSPSSAYLSPKRSPPALSISTDPLNQGGRSSTSVIREGSAAQQTLTVNRPWLQDQPQSAPPNLSEFPSLKLRPVSTLFSAHFEHIVAPDTHTSNEIDSEPLTSSSPNTIVSPLTPASASRNHHEAMCFDAPLGLEEPPTVKHLQDQLASAKKAYQMQIWELEGQVRDLKAELDLIKSKSRSDVCLACGREKDELTNATAPKSVVNRPRARTGTSTRFGSVLP